MTHLSIFLHVILCCTSVLAITVTFIYFKKTKLIYLKYLAIYFILKLSFYSARMITYYTVMNTDLLPTLTNFHIIRIYAIFIYLVSLATLYYFLKMILSILGSDNKFVLILHIIFSIVIFLLAFYNQLNRLVSTSRDVGILASGLAAWYTIFIYLSTSLLVMLRSRAHVPIKRKQMIFFIGLFFLASAVFYIVVTILADNQFIQNDSLILYYLLNAIFVSLIPAIFIEKVVERLESGSKYVYEPAKIDDNIFEKYAISKREQEIVMLVCEGKSNQDISDQLCISYQTVKSHIHNILQKTELVNRMQLMRLFYGSDGDEKV